MTNHDVIAKWLKQERAQVGHLRTDGHTLWSYSTAIAEWEGDGVCLNRTKYSMTTSRHQNMVEAAVLNSRLIYGKISYTSRNIPRGRERLVLKYGRTTQS